MFSPYSSHWNSFWFRPLDPRPLAVFRIAIGLLCLVIFSASLPNWHRFYGADGIISLNSAEFRNDRVNSPWGLFYWTEGVLPVETWWVAGMAFSTLLLIGLRTRLATFGMLILIDAMLRRNTYLANGEDMVVRMSLLYCLFIDLGAVWSVDARKRARCGRPPVTALFAWPIRMLQINVALIYAISLPYKLAQDPGWVTGDALHWTIASDMWGPYEHPWLTLAYGGLLRKLMTFGTVFVEAFFPLAVRFNRTRRPAIAMITGLHLGIALMIPNVTFFTLSMVCTFMAFLTATDMDALQNIAARLYSWFGSPKTVGQIGSNGRSGTPRIQSAFHRVRNGN